jgi:SAM-dependent methyltransferase
MDKKLTNDIIQWDIKNWSKALSFWESALDNKPKKKAIAFGERGGGLSLWLAMKGYDVICSDYKDILNDAKELHLKYGVSNKISYAIEDITNISYEDNRFDVVVFKSVIGSLGTYDKQVTAFKELHRILKPGGYLLFAENIKASILIQLARNKFISWSERWRYPHYDEIISFGSLFNKFDFKTYGTLALFGRNEKQRNILAFFDRILTPITPKKWRYILFGVCKK